MSEKELTSFKEELLKEIRVVESRLKEEFVKKILDIEEKNNDHYQQCELLFTRSQSIFNTVISHKVQLDKLNDIDTFKTKINDMVISHEIRINNSLKDIEEMKYKYDKAINDNLFLPGFIGPNCQYKVISDYLRSNIEDMSKIKADKEILIKDTKEYKKKIDDIIKTVVNLVDSSSVKNIQYTNEKYDDLNELLTNYSNKFNDKIAEIRSNVSSIHKNNDEDFQKYLKEFENYYDKKEINDMINFKFKELNSIINECISQNETIGENIKKQNEEFHSGNKVFNRKIAQLNFQIKELENTMKQCRTRVLKINRLLGGNKITNAITLNKDIENSPNINKTLYYSPLVKSKTIVEENEKSPKKIINIKERNNFNDVQRNSIKKIKKKNSIERVLLKEFQSEKNIDNNKININEKNSTSIINCNDTKNTFSEDEDNILKIQFVNIPEIQIEKVKLPTPSNSSKNNDNFSWNKNEESKNPPIIKKKSHNIHNYIDNVENKIDKISDLKVRNIFNNNNQNNQSLFDIKIKKPERERNLSETDNIFIEKNDEFSTINNSHNLVSLGYRKNNTKSPCEVYTLATKGLHKKRKITLDCITHIKNVYSSSYPVNTIGDSRKMINSEIPVKIKSVFGRTGYTLYDKKEEAFNKIINIRSKKFNNGLEMNLMPKGKIQLSHDDDML